MQTMLSKQNNMITTALPENSNLSSRDNKITTRVVIAAKSLLFNWNPVSRERAM